VLWNDLRRDERWDYLGSMTANFAEASNIEANVRNYGQPGADILGPPTDQEYMCVSALEMKVSQIV
jgi:hypothetical protein